MNKALTYDDVLLIPQYSEIQSRSQIDTSVTLGTKKFKYPIVSANMDTITGMRMAQAMHKAGAFYILNRHQYINYDFEDWRAIIERIPIKSFCVGVKERDKKFLEFLSYDDTWESEELFITIDVAHGHSKAVIDQIKYIRSQFAHMGKINIIAGNVATYEGAEALVEAGADAIKIGIGPGSLCSTRIVTGCGYPQLSAIYNIATYFHNSGIKNIKLIADGGIKNSGDIVKALAAGADMVMLGSLLAGTVETPGQVYTRPDGSSYKVYRGQASFEAQNDQKKESSEIYAEGVYKETPYTHRNVEQVVEELMKGVRSGMSYCGSRDIDELHNKAIFIEVTNSTILENSPHGIS